MIILQGKHPQHVSHCFVDVKSSLTCLMLFSNRITKSVNMTVTKMFLKTICFYMVWA